MEESLRNLGGTQVNQLTGVCLYTKRSRDGRVARASVFFLPVTELWVPRPCVLGKGGSDAACTMGFVMPSGLHRTYGAHHLHFITCSCYRRLPFLRTARSCDGKRTVVTVWTVG